MKFFGKNLKVFVVLLFAMVCYTDLMDAQVRTNRGNTNTRGGGGQVFDDASRSRFNISEKIYIGGSFGGNLNSFGGGGRIFLDLSPIVGYRVTPKFIVGAGPMYTFFKAGNLQSSIWGGRVMTRYTVFRNVFAQAEVQNLVLKDKAFDCKDSVRRFPIGGGISQSLGGAFRLNGVLMYDLLYNGDGGLNNTNCNSPALNGLIGNVFNSPLIVRGGFSLGF